MVARPRGEVQAAPFRVGAVRVRGASVPGETGGGAGDVPPPVQGESRSAGVEGGSGRDDITGEPGCALMMVTQWVRGSGAERGPPPFGFSTRSRSSSCEQNLKPLEVSASVSCQIAAQALPAAPPTRSSSLAILAGRSFRSTSETKQTRPLEIPHRGGRPPGSVQVCSCPWLVG